MMWDVSSADGMQPEKSNDWSRGTEKTFHLKTKKLSVGKLNEI